MEAKKEPKIESDKPKEEAVKTEKKEDSNTQVKQEAKEEPNTETALFKDPLLESFYTEVNKIKYSEISPIIRIRITLNHFKIDDIKPEDFKTNSKEQLERLLRPGSTYFNLNPFEVLQIDPYLSVDEIKKKYRKVSRIINIFQLFLLSNDSVYVYKSFRSMFIQIRTQTTERELKWRLKRSIAPIRC